MFLDAFLRVSNAQALTATAVSTSSIDQGVVDPDREIGTGEPIGFGVFVSVAADATTGNETYQFDVVADDDAALGSPTVLSSSIRTAAQLAAGSAHFFEVPIGFPRERYLGMQYTLGGTTPTITLSAYLMPRSLFSILAKAYPKNYTV
jgi:hypothetical protein